MARSIRAVVGEPSAIPAVTSASAELAADRPDFVVQIAVDRDTGVLLRLVETIGGVVTRLAQVSEIAPDAPLAPNTFQFVFPTGTTMLY